jgi:hypothetical protein
MNLFKNLFKSKQLQREVDELKTALVECSNKLVEKQEHINTTNAYWKKRMHETTKTSKTSRKKKEL